MKDKIILDRSYAYYLISYLGKLERKNDKYSLYDENQAVIVNHTINVINWASILYKKILIEDYYASSLSHLTRNHTWFWELFETYSPDKVISDNPDLSLIIEDSVKFDMKDKDLIKFVQKNLSREYSENNRFSSLIWNINRTLQTAKILNSAILPWPDKLQLYHYKFANALIFEEKTKPLFVLRSVFEIQAPSFSIETLDELKMIRSDPRISSLRKLIWELVDNDDADTKEKIFQEIESQKSDLITQLKPSNMRFIRSLLSSPIPFPFNMGIEGLYHLIDLQKMEPYEWYFLLIDCKDFPNPKNLEIRE
jgi:hypothetical protein